MFFFGKSQKGKGCFNVAQAKRSIVDWNKFLTLNLDLRTL